MQPFLSLKVGNSGGLWRIRDEIGDCAGKRETEVAEVSKRDFGSSSWADSHVDLSYFKAKSSLETVQLGTRNMSNVVNSIWRFAFS
jgi:hypothetical protein